MRQAVAPVLSEDGISISEEIYQKNKETLQKIIYVNIMHINRKAIDENTLREILNVCKQANDYQLTFSTSTLKWVKENWKFSEEDWYEFESIVRKEDKE